MNLPAGVILPFAGGTIPSNCLHCNGAAISRTDYELLFQAIGTTWGVGNGTSTFNVPDLRDRALYGAGNVIGLAATDGRAAGSRGGPFHHHYFGQTSDGGGSHSHSFSGGGSTGGGGSHQHLARDDGTPSVAQGSSPTGASGTARYTTQNERYYTGSAGDHSHSVSVSGNTSSDGSHSHWVDGDTGGGYDDKPAYAGINYIIATGKNV